MARLRRSGSTAIAIAAWLGLGSGLGCGPIVQIEDDTGSSEDDGTTTSPPPGTTVPGTTAPPPVTTAGTTITTTTATTDETFGESLGDETWSNFIRPTDDDFIWAECGIFEQDCPEGEKCMPWAADGGSAWNATRCSPVALDPDGVGDPCVVEGSPVSGVDSCDYGSMCWDVDSKTLQGTCVAFCVGDETNPSCEDDNAMCLINGEGVLAICLPKCDPILQDCGPGQGCYPVGDEFMCGPDASGDMGAPGDTCEFINVCDPGTFCANFDLVPGCMSGVGCCSSFCDLTDPMPPCLPGQDCVPWYEPGMAPPAYQEVGACVVPM